MRPVLIDETGCLLGVFRERRLRHEKTRPSFYLFVCLFIYFQKGTWLFHLHAQRSPPSPRTTQVAQQVGGSRGSRGQAPGPPEASVSGSTHLPKVWQSHPLEEDRWEECGHPVGLEFEINNKYFSV